MVVLSISLVPFPQSHYFYYVSLYLSFHTHRCMCDDVLSTCIMFDNNSKTFWKTNGFLQGLQGWLICMSLFLSLNTYSVIHLSHTRTFVLYICSAQCISPSGIHLNFLLPKANSPTPKWYSQPIAFITKYTFHEVRITLYQVSL